MTGTDYKPRSINATLADLPAEEMFVESSTLTQHVKEEFDRRPNLPGAIVTENGRFFGVISRDLLFRCLSRQFYLELFLKKPIREFVSMWCDETLRLKSSCTIHRAAEQSLARPLSMAYNPILVEFEDGRVGLLDVYSLLVAQSQLLTLSKMIEEQKILAEKANQAKSEFLANISHELRTPLHGINSFSRFGLDEADDGDRKELKEYFAKVNQCADTLLTLVNDLLDLAKLESGRMEFQLAPCNVSELVNNVLDEFRSICSRRQLSFQFSRTSCDTNAYVDPDKIKQVIRNLISNAVKFSPDNETISVSVRRVGKSLLISVRDEGPGIPQSEIEDIFDKFVQSSKTKSGQGGTGLGLAICREIVTGHNGRIWAENNEDKGVVFFCEISTDLEQYPCQK